MACATFCVRGRVQGVSFRAATRTQALRLGLTGHAHNLADGSVEVLACGDAAALRELQHWLQHGPPGARVDGVARSDATCTAPCGFDIA